MTVQIHDAFWQRYIKLIREEMIPFQWDVLHDQADIAIAKERDDDNIPSEKSNAIENFKIAAGQKEGQHYGWLFQDSDVYKWLESAANTYAIKPDLKLKQMMDEVVTLIEETQDSDGYISTFYQIEAPELKFRRLFESHELYCAGHLIEAAVAHYKATEDNRLIIVSKKLVHCIQNAFGSEKGKINGADGHQEIELALIRLYELTKNTEYLELSQWFLEIRGQDPEFYHKQLAENKKMNFDQTEIPTINTLYFQAHKPVLEQDEAVGHAVRLVYMAAAMAEVAHYTHNEKMFSAAKKIWENIVTKRMYITGGIGSTVHGEAFTLDYDLPNDTMYCETCASIGLMFFANAMLKNEPDAAYAEVMERGLYNTVISGMALDGRHFFYVNPLEVDPKVSGKNPGKGHVKATRPSWFGCACCPPNLSRTLTSLDKYSYSISNETLMVNLYIDNSGELYIGDNRVQITQHAKLRENGLVCLEVITDQPIKIGLRVPSWSADFVLKQNGEVMPYQIEKGYVYVDCKGVDTYVLSFNLPVIHYASHPSIKNNVGKVALQRGPFVYCLEEDDNEGDLHLYRLISDEIKAESVSDPILGDFMMLTTQGEKAKKASEWENHLYLPHEKQTFESKEIRFIPYHLWANRSSGEMAVWIAKNV